MAQRKTIGSSPLDAVIPLNVPSKEETKENPKSIKAVSQKKEKQRLTVHVPVDLVERVKNSVYWTPGLTLAGLAEQVFLAAVENLEAKYGGSFPARESELKGGRPLK